MDDRIANVAEETLRRRLAQYPTTLQVRGLSVAMLYAEFYAMVQEDEAMLHEAQPTRHKFHALVVRIGEKSILAQVLQHLQASKTPSPRKRKAEDLPGNHASKKR